MCSEFVFSIRQRTGFRFTCIHFNLSSDDLAGPRSAIGRAPDSLVRVLGSIPGLATYFLSPSAFFQEGQLSVTGEILCKKYWLTA